MTVTKPAPGEAADGPLGQPLLAATGGAEEAGKAAQNQPLPTGHLTPLWALKAIYFVSVGANAGLFRFITVFYHSIGLGTAHIGLLQLLNPWVTFGGSFCWAALCDRTGAYKGVLVATSALGAATVCCLLLPEVQRHFAAVCCCMIIGPGLLASRAGVTDALTLRVVEEYQALAEQQPPGAEDDPGRRRRSLPSYGEQRLWGAAGYGWFGLLSGLLADAFGNAAMFALFAACLGATVLVIGTQLPSNVGARRTGQASGASKVAPGRLAPLLCRFEVLWFFANLVVYGAHMALVESFLFVYLVRDFPSANRRLLGASVAVMCACEIPVFRHIDRFTKGGRASLTVILTVCQVIFAARTFAYSRLPTEYPWLVLFIEPLHGVTQAAMWSCSVAFGRRLAPTGAEARMQALVAGIYYRAAAGAGAAMWGALTRPPPEGFGFRPMYELATCTILLWSVLWNLGWRCHDAAAPVHS